MRRILQTFFPNTMFGSTMEEVKFGPRINYQWLSGAGATHDGPSLQPATAAACATGA